MKSSLDFFKPEDNAPKTAKIQITTNAYIDYKAMDSRVVSVGPLMECSPMRTHIVVQKQHEEDIVALLKAHPEIHAVNGDWTEFGLMEQEKMKGMFSNMSR